MSASESNLFPLVGLQAVANAHNEWVAVTLHVPQHATGPLAAAFGAADVYALLAPLDCIIPLADPHSVDEALLAQLTPQRTIFRLSATLAADKVIKKKCLQWRDAGYRILLDGPGAGPVVAAQIDARALSVDAACALPGLHQLMPLPGPHLAYNIDDEARLAALHDLGVSWFAGDYALSARRQYDADEGASRRRLLALLGLLARDADVHELEVPLKQDPGLSYHLLKLVNSAAFAYTAPISSFGQAISLLGRRQLQRWLQLLLYARQQDDGKINALLPLAAVRAAHMEALCALRGGDRDQQDLAFMVGVFSLLDILLGMPMQEIVATLNLEHSVNHALLARSGDLGSLLALVESGTHPPAALLASAGIDGETYWRSLLQAYQWAIQVSRNL